MDIELGFPGTNNNGNVASQTIRSHGSTWFQTYPGYDGLNRLMEAREAGGFVRNYEYDQAGNRWVSGSSGLSFADGHEPTGSSWFNAGNNRLNLESYDGAGNLTSFSPYTVSYTGDNQVREVFSGSNGVSRYLYDGNGRRVRKEHTPGGGSASYTFFVYDAMGKLAAEYTTGSPGGGGLQYVFADWLGSTRAITDQNQQMVARYDYLPFGRMLTAGDTGRTTGMGFVANPTLTGTKHRFTGQMRDGETTSVSRSGLDFMEARYFSAGQGRFTSPDEPFAGQSAGNSQVVS